jgi:hypothetical protein
LLVAMAAVSEMSVLVMVPSVIPAELTELAVASEPSP